ncbi:MAG TPA: NAD(P)-dependent oxidoreductase [Gemmatimonadales bacterium]|nr:NAD(P)-dependent oxidoreductase [Gemmatimonadales bacterium]
MSLDEELSRPTPALLHDLRSLEGPLIILGAGGKMGPTLARMARRSLAQLGLSHEVIAVSRFSDGTVRSALEEQGVRTVACDLFERAAVHALPDAPDVVYMVGQKFGTSEDAGRTWAANAYVPGVVAERYRGSRIVAFSTGNVYPLTPVAGEGPDEATTPGPVGEYAQSALARERVLEFFSRRHQTRMAILRLNYAVEPRYGVLRDLADQVQAGVPVDVAMGWVNVIWQRDANEIALRCLGRCQTPPFILNVTGRPALRVRWLAEQFARRFGVDARFRGEEAATALLSNARLLEQLFGPPPTGVDEMIDRVAEWVKTGGESLGKPTHFEMREGRY